MASIKISQLNTMTRVTSDDFIPIVDSGSLTTFHTPISTLGAWIDDSGSCLSASWASRSINAYGTASYALKAKEIGHSFVRTASVIQENAVNVCSVFGEWHTQVYMVTLHGVGYHLSCEKTYIISIQYTSPAFSPPYEYTPHSLISTHTGWFTAKPLVASHRYPFEDNYYTDYDLEVSHSGVGKLHFRVRSTKVHIAATAPIVELFFLPLSDREVYFTDAGTSEEASSNALPAWPSAFVTQQGNYKFIISGSTQSTNGFTGSLIGTSSWATTASYAPTSSHSTSASYALISNSSSYANTSSVAITASWALGFPSDLTGSSAIPGLLPVGAVVDFCGTTLDDANWLMCTGSAISRTDYAQLFGIIGTTWGIGDGATTFNLPDLRKRMTLGMRDSQHANSFISASVGDIGGGEAYNYHYHIFGSNAHSTTFTNNDFWMVIQSMGVINTARNFPMRSYGGTYMPVWLLPGDGTSLNLSGYGAAGTTNTIWLGTSYGISDTHDWYDGEANWNDNVAVTGLTSTYPDKTDLAMPYAVVMKIIRAR